MIDTLLVNLARIRSRRVIGVTLVVPLVILAFYSLSACGQATEPTSTESERRPLTSSALTRAPTPTSVEATQIPEVMVTAPLPGEKVLETEHFAYYVENGHLPVDLNGFAEAAESIYDEVRASLGAGSSERIILSFQPPENVPCPARGTTFFDETGPRVTIFADQQTDDVQIRGVLAHEVAHVLQTTEYGPGLEADRNLAEGVTTWFTRAYWTTWMGTESLDGMVNEYIETGDYVPLVDADVFSAYPGINNNLMEECLARRDQLYTQWASFAGYLINTSGWQKFLELMASALPDTNGQMAVFPVPSDYQGIYGKTLQALETEWLAQLGE